MSCCSSASFAEPLSDIGLIIFILIANDALYVFGNFYREAHQSMIENRKVLLERLERTEDALNSQIANLKSQLSETEKKLHGAFCYNFILL